MKYKIYRCVSYERDLEDLCQRICQDNREVVSVVFRVGVAYTQHDEYVVLTKTIEADL